LLLHLYYTFQQHKKQALERISSIKVISKVNSDEDETAALAAPLLGGGDDGDDYGGGEDDDDNNVDAFGAALLTTFNTRRMDGGSTGVSGTDTSGGNNNNNNNGSNMGSGNSIVSQNVLVRGTVTYCLQIRTLADVLFPSTSLLYPLVTSGKWSFIVFLAVNLVFVVLWLPFWVSSYFVGEWGIYALTIGTVFLVGRVIIRLIAFPGSSHRVSGEIEKEFAKYSVRMISSSANSLVDLSAAILGSSKGPSMASGGDGTSNQPVSSYEIVSLWKRAKSYRDRVLGVYAEVLHFTLQDTTRTVQAPSSNSSHSSADRSNADLNKYGNNRLVGDVGDLSGLTLEARRDGRVLLQHLEKTLTQLYALEMQAKPLLEGSASASSKQLSIGARQAATGLMITATELQDFCESLKPPTSSGSDGASSTDGDDSEDLTVDQMRRRFEEQNGSIFDTIKSGLASILPMLDPPLHSSIFGFDVLRGCVLSRYRGARQLWVQRPSGGMVDVLHFPKKPSPGSTPSARNSKAVLYCNPNAGLIEVATGMSLAGGNVTAESEDVVNDNCWTDFYTNLGFDVYLYNYAGFGRSFGAGLCGIGKRGGEERHVKGAWGRIRRILHGTFCSFRPTPDTLRSDGIAVADHIVSQLGVDSLVIHGESIGGVAASGTARKLTENNPLRDKVALLICDRTFCNLEAVAQRLVGGWSGYAIRTLAPFWSTDVVGDYLAATCPKVVATDAADAIIADTSSLKSGVAFWKEIRRGSSSTKGVGWITDAPLHYRMADWENVCVTDSRYVPLGVARTTAPVWPGDKYISVEEGFHFAACAKRIGKLASMEKKRFVLSLSAAADAEGGMMDACQAPIYLVWRQLGCLEGLCGSALGIAVKGGFDTTVAWLCNTLTFGGQTVVEAMEHRHKWSDEEAYNKLNELGDVQPSDFDCRPPGYEKQESETVVHPKPIPEVVTDLKSIMEAHPNDEIMNSVSHELSFVVGTLEYVHTRLSSAAVVETSWKNRHLRSEGPMAVGSFMNLHCGHNNPFSESERKRLKALVVQATFGPSSQSQIQEC
jgi:pimeloyl-ACP methyl ester carboxylesterase